jgi:hypothetical protein
MCYYVHLFLSVIVDVLLEPATGQHHLEISIIPMLGHPFYTCEYSHGARAWQGFVAILSM